MKIPLHIALELVQKDTKKTAIPNLTYHQICFIFISTLQDYSYSNDPPICDPSQSTMSYTLNSIQVQISVRKTYNCLNTDK